MDMYHIIAEYALMPPHQIEPQADISREPAILLLLGPFLILLLLLLFLRRYDPWACRTFYHYMYVQQVHRKTVSLRPSKLRHFHRPPTVG
jgi:hypothetical protein